MNPNSYNLISFRKDYIFLIIILVFVVFFIILFNTINETHKPLTIKNVSPQNNSTSVSVVPEIYVVFSRQPNGSEINQITITASPDIKGSLKWNISKISLIPSALLDSNKTYKLTVTYLDQKYSWGFKTKTQNQETQQDIIKIQGLGDQNFNNAYQQIYKDYPWYDKLPITTNQYFIYFDPNSKKFVAKIYIDSKSNISQDDQLSTAKQNIQDSLKKIAGSDVDKYGIEWMTIVQ